jgi:dTDP-4-amino-4,6-dideoxygalactose transaminase
VVEGHVFHQYTIRVKNGRRDTLEDALSERDIGHKVYYPVPCHQLPVYEDRAYHLPEAERASDEVLSLPMWPQAEKDVQERVARVVRTVLQ